MRAPEDDFHLGRHLLENRLVSREALLECLFQMAHERRAGTPRPLGVLLVSRNLITEEELNRILSERTSPDGPVGNLTEAQVGKLLIAAGLISQENVEECVKLQDDLRRAGKEAPPLGSLIVSRGYVTEAQVNRVLAYQHKAVMACPGCGVRVTTKPPPPGSRYQCRKCGEALVPAGGAAVEGPLGLRETEHGEDTQLEIDRAAAAFVKQKKVVRLEHLRQCQRLELEFARYGLMVPLLELMRRMGFITWDEQQQFEQMDFGKLVKDAGWRAEAIPGYKLQERIAAGGFAAIWRAQALFGTEKVAVKLLHPERSKDPRSVARFEWEAMLLRKFVSPHIVRGIDAGFERGSHYLIMEHVDGRSLGQALSESGAFPVRDALYAARQVGLALVYLHGQGYLHRDVKPDNALIDYGGAVKLCDLGFVVPIPKHRAEGAASTVVGTAGYLSPEAARGDGLVGVGADLYSLGILLYALLTGHEPFGGAASEEVIAESLGEGMPVPNLMLVPAPPPVIGLLKKTMHPDPARRFSAAADLVAAIDKAIEE